MSIENNIPSKKEIKGFGEIRPEISACFKIIVSLRTRSEKNKTPREAKKRGKKWNLKAKNIKESKRRKKE